MAEDSTAPMTVGAIWQAMIDALRADFGVYFALMAPFTLLVSMIVEQFGPAPPTSMAEFTPKVAVILILIPSIIGAIGQLALTWLIATPGGTPAKALGIGLRALPFYLLAVLLITPATSLGLVFLLIPGLYLFARFFLIGPVLVIERPGVVAAVRRSWALTAQSAWTIVLFLVLALLFVIGAGVLASGIGAALGLLFTSLGLKSVGGFVAALVAATISTVFAMASASAGVAIYRRTTALSR